MQMICNQLTFVSVQQDPAEIPRLGRSLNQDHFYQITNDKLIYIYTVGMRKKDDKIQSKTQFGSVRPTNDDDDDDDDNDDGMSWNLG